MTSARTGRGNRYGLAIVGLVLALGGAAALAVGFGVFGLSRANAPLLTPAQSRYVHANGWFWPVVAAAAAIAAIAALRWLLRQTRRERIATLIFDTDRRRGDTRLRSSAATNAIEAEIADYPGVTGAHAYLTGSPTHPELAVRVSAEKGVDLGALRTSIRTGAITHLREALELDRLPTRLTLRLDTARASRHLS